MITAKTGLAVRVSGPQNAGRCPHVLTHQKPRFRYLAALAPLSLLGAILAGCSQGSADVEPPVVLGMTPSIPPYYSDDEITLYEVQAKVPLPIMKPTAQQESALGKGVTPFPHAPYLLASDITVELHYTISNLDVTDQTIELLIDPWNEFGRWSPGVTIVDEDDTQPNLSGYDNYFLVPAKSRIEGTLTSDDIINLETNFATVESVLMAPPANLSVDLTTFCNHVFDIQNRSNDGDPLTTPYIPSVIPGLTGFDLGLRTEAPTTIAIELTMDITDNNGNRVLPDDSTTAPIGRPGNVFAPPGSIQAASN